MGKLLDLKVVERNYPTLESLICDIVDEFGDSISEYYCISIAVTSDEVPDMITALLSTGKFKPDVLDYNSIDYDCEYHISIDNQGSLYIEKAWNEIYNNYTSIEYTENKYVLVSDMISSTYFKTINDGDNFIILYHIED